MNIESYLSESIRTIIDVYIWPYVPSFSNHSRSTTIQRSPNQWRDLYGTIIRYPSFDEFPSCKAIYSWRGYKVCLDKSFSITIDNGQVHISMRCVIGQHFKVICIRIVPDLIRRKHACGIVGQKTSSGLEDWVNLWCWGKEKCALCVWR